MVVAAKTSAQMVHRWRPMFSFAEEKDMSFGDFLVLVREQISD
jgi:hypothetical protein